MFLHVGSEGQIVSLPAGSKSEKLEEVRAILEADASLHNDGEDGEEEMVEEDCEVQPDPEPHQDPESTTVDLDASSNPAHVDTSGPYEDFKTPVKPHAPAILEVSSDEEPPAAAASEAAASEEPEKIQLTDALKDCSSPFISAMLDL